MIADLLFPLSLPLYLSYSIPDSLAGSAARGMWVTAPLGRRRCRGVIASIREGDTENLKAIFELDMENPPIGERQWELLRWMASYYLCRQGDVLRLFPSDGIAKDIDKLRQTCIIKGNAWVQGPDVLPEGINRSPRQRDLLLRFMEKSIDGIALEETMLEGEAQWKTALITCIRKRFLKKTHILPPVSLSQIKSSSTAPYTDAKVIGKVDSLLETLDRGAVSLTGFNREQYLLQLFYRLLEKREDILLLCPDVSIASRWFTMLSPHFGNRVIPFTPTLSAVQRGSSLQKLLSAKKEDCGRLFIGTRQSLFLPFPKLSLIVADYQDDVRYKNDTGVRYNTCDCAMVLARIHHSKILLCGEAQSLGTRFNLSQGKLIEFSLQKPLNLPKIRLIDTKADIISDREAYPCSPRLVRSIIECMEKGRKALFLFPLKSELQEDTANQLRMRFPELVMNSYRNGMQDIDSNIGAVIFYQSDRYFTRGDFRSHEKAMLLISQYQQILLSEAANASILIECPQSRMPLYEAAEQGFPQSFLDSLWNERQEYNYPPFCRLIIFTIQNRTDSICLEQAEALSSFLEIPSLEKLGPYQPQSFTRDYFVRQICLKIPRVLPLGKIKTTIEERLAGFRRIYKQASLTIDVDPR